MPAERAAQVDEGKRVIIVVPAYNEARKIREVVQKLLARWVNVVVVDDGSTDGTSTMLHGLNVHVLRHTVNRGQGAALQTGIRYACARDADVVVTFDADGQHDTEDVCALVEPILHGECDVTLGSRFLGRTYNIPLGRLVLLKCGVWFTRVFSRMEVTDVHNGLRAFSRAAAAALRIRMDRMAHASEILDEIRRGGWRYREIPVTVYYSEYSLAKGQSSWDAMRIAAQLLLKRIWQ